MRNPQNPCVPELAQQPSLLGPFHSKWKKTKQGEPTTHIRGRFALDLSSSQFFWRKLGHRALHHIFPGPATKKKINISTDPQGRKPETLTANDRQPQQILQKVGLRSNGAALNKTPAGKSPWHPSCAYMVPPSPFSSRSCAAAA